MSKFRKFAIGFILVELLILSGFDIFIGKNLSSDGDREYMVDISRISRRIENGEKISDIDLKNYQHILAVHVYDESEIYKNKYEIKKIDNEIYLFEYSEKTNNIFYLINYPLIASIVLNIFLLIYLDKKIVTPFSRMESLTTDLAKGALAVPLKQEKSKYFGKYLWGMDMLREKLETDKMRELKLLKEKKTLILSLSHDIKTPLSAIDLYIRALKKGVYKTEEERNTVFSGMERNVAEITGYIQEIANASREEILVLDTKNDEVYLSGIISKIKEYYCEKMRSLHVEFEVEDEENLLIFGDENRIIEVMQNVIENALKYGDGRKITVSFDDEEECRLVTISNSGCSLPKDELPHIFDSFYRGSNVNNQNGSGLGLYICRELMRKMEGEVFAVINNDIFSVTLVLRKV